VGAEGGIAVLDRGVWQRIDGVPGLKIMVRTFATDAAGLVLVGTHDGHLLAVKGNRLERAEASDFSPSGVFCFADAQDGHMWLANKAFIGRLTPAGWKPCGPQLPAREPILATTARQGGLWIYRHSHLLRYRSDGTSQDFSASDVDQPRELFEDRNGTIWLASNLRGLIRMKPGAPFSTISTTNGLANNSVWSVLEDTEGNIWAGTSSGGLHRLRPRQFVNYGIPQGLPDQIVRTLTEESSGRILVGTHGGGTARIENGKVIGVRPVSLNTKGAYIWSVLRDHAGQVWLGTYNGGLLQEVDGVEKPFPDWPSALGQTVNSLFEDAKGRIWVGTTTGLGLIEHGRAQCWPPGSNALTVANIRSIAEDVRSGTLWLGTYNHGLFRLEGEKLTHLGRAEGLPGDRISSLAFDDDGCLWVGVFSQGLICVRDGKSTQVGRGQGLQSDTVGSILEDGLGQFWLGSDHGILRVSSESLHRVVRQLAPRAEFNVFDRTAGLGTAECAEGLQPTALRDHAGRLWFATLKGVVTVDPRELCLNTNQPPVLFEAISYSDPSGATHVLRDLGSARKTFPPGISELQFKYAALTYTAPEKVVFFWSLEGAGRTWTATSARHAETFHALGPGTYRLKLRAANNDGLWNTTGAAVTFRIQPFPWQTAWFRLLALCSLAGGVGFTGWRLARSQLRRQFERLEQQRDRTRLAAVMEGTSDLVVFADHVGTVLHINPAGRRLLGIGAGEELAGLKLSRLHSPEEAERIEQQAIRAAQKSGTWEGETFLRHRDGRNIPVSQVIVAHQDETGRVNFLSTIARDISERKRAQEEKDRLQGQLAQSQKMESIGRLAGGVAHDFNNMLQVILGNASLALESLTADNPVHGYLLEIERSALRSAELTGQLLAFARKQPVRPRILDLNETVTGMLKMLRRLIGEDIRLKWTPGANLWTVKLDPIQLDQILVNLTVNARDAIDGDGTLTIETANTSFTDSRLEGHPETVTGDYVMLSVSDTDKGMTKEVQWHLFEPFFTTKEVGKGTGLGLAMIFGIVNQNKGFIKVSSEPGKGSTFQIYFPGAESRPAPPAVPTQPQDLAAGGGTVLVVEDEGQILQVVTRILELGGCTVLATQRPEQALLLARAHPGKIHLLVTNVIMPGMNGRELKEKLEVIQPGLKCLYMSGYTADVIAHHGVLEEGVEFLQKPFKVADLAGKVRKLLSEPLL
jgi:PAS domain S-box-containing protein